MSRPSAGGTLGEDEIGAIIAAQFPDPPRRRRKKKTTRKAGTTRKKKTKKKAAKKKVAKKKAGKKSSSAPKTTERKTEPFEVLSAVAEASSDPGQAEQLWGDEVLGLLREAAEGLAAEVEQATSTHARALATHAEERAAAASPQVEREPAFLQLLPDDFVDEDAPLEVFDADALCDEMGVWDDIVPEEPSAPAEATEPVTPRPEPTPPAPAVAAVTAAPSDPVEWNAMVDYLAKGREAARAARAARSLQKRAAAAVMEFTPVGEQRREFTPSHLAVVGLMLLGWGATYYVRTGDLRVAIGMLSWASCVGCALALFQRPS